MLMELLLTIPSLAADDASSAAAATLPEESIAADARGESPRANDDGSQVELIYSGESDGESDSKRTPSHTSL